MYDQCSVAVMSKAGPLVLLHVPVAQLAQPVAASIACCMRMRGDARWRNWRASRSEPAAKVVTVTTRARGGKHIVQG